MSSSLPVALIVGIEHFAAKKLAIELINKDIRVVGVGEWVGISQGTEKFEYRQDLDEVKERLSYIFDFTGNTLAWNKSKEDGAKLTIVRINQRASVEELKELNRFDGNWRVVEAKGVYGPGMEDNEMLSGALRQSVTNKNLVLPNAQTTIRLLCVDDLIEAILRASFLSGTDREIFSIWGQEITSLEIAETLIDQAKMTRFKVMEGRFEIEKADEEEVSINWKKLRWSPQVTFREGIKETLQYYFAKIDEENRRKPKESVKAKVEKEMPVPTGDKIRRAFEVVVDEFEEKEEGVKESKVEREVILPEVLIEEEEEIQTKSNKEAVKEKESEERVEEPERIEEVEEVEEESEDIPVIKNSNIRRVAVKESVKEESNTSDDIEKQIEAVVQTEKEKAVEEVKEIRRSRIKPKRKFRGWPCLVGILVLVCLSVPSYWVLNGYLLASSINKVMKQVEEKKYEEAGNNAEKAIIKIKKLDSDINDWGWNKLKIMRDYQTGLRVLGNVAEVEKKAVALIKIGDDLNEAVFNEKEIEWKKTITGVKNGMEEIEAEIGVLQARLDGDWSWLPARWRTWPIKTKNKLGEIKQNISLGRNSLEFIPDIIGVAGGRREYMVLFQNESEIRPTGGFIGSYAILSFENGKLLNLDIRDIYEADGQLKGHVDPPEEIKTHLGEAAWYMRDANWQANFLASSKDIQWFLEKETGRKVDGVIGINLAVAKAMLSAVGEVYVPDFGEKINKDNLYEQAEFYSETKFFPGSNQKASFLGGLGKQLFEEIKGLKPEKRLKLAEAMIEMLEKNEIQIALNDKKIAEKVAMLGWDGSIYDGKCAIDRCFADYLYVVEANLGVNKANYFLVRSMEQSVDVSQNAVSRVLRINYENTSKNSNWPGGDYKNYLRIYLPADVNLSEVSLIDGYDATNKKIFSGDELKIKNIGNKKEIGFLINVPVLKKRIVEVRYSNAIDLSNKDKFSYLHYVQKQSGFGDTGMVTLVSFPGGWQPLQVQPAASLVNGKLLFNQRIEKDLKMGVELSK